MTRKQLVQIWRNLWFWQRVLIECLLAISIFLLVEFLFSGRSGDFGESIISGAVFGVIVAVIDHAFLASNGNRATRHR